MTKQPEAEEPGPFFVVKDYGEYGVMSQPEIMEDESVLLASEPFDTRAEAEATLHRGLADGSYKPIKLP
jgi:hypothetical protein